MHQDTVDHLNRLACKQNIQPQRPWIGVDMDGTLAKWPDNWQVGLGDPVPSMINRVKAWLGAGECIKIFTSRAWQDNTGYQRAMIEAWCQEHLGQVLEITCEKDWWCKEIWDDIGRHVIANTGIVLHEEQEVQELLNAFAKSGL